MATSLADLLVALTDGVTAINSLNARLERIFPQQTASSSGVPAGGGTITFASSQAAIFLSVLTSSGGTYQVPGYLP